MKGFIETTDRNDTNHLINIHEIVSIEDVDKYTRVIRLNIVDENGNHVIIRSQNSYQELMDMIKEAQEE